MPRNDKPTRAPDICCTFNNFLQVCSRMSALSRIIAEIKKLINDKMKITHRIVKIIILLSWFQIQ